MLCYSKIEYNNQKYLKMENTMKNFKKLTLFVAIATVASSQISATSISDLMKRIKPDAAQVGEAILAAQDEIRSGWQNASSELRTYVEQAIHDQKYPSSTVIQTLAKPALDNTVSTSSPVSPSSILDRIGYAADVLERAVQGAVKGVSCAAQEVFAGAGYVADLGVSKTEEALKATLENLNKVSSAQVKEAVVKLAQSTQGQVGAFALVSSALCYLAYKHNAALAHAEASEITSESLKAAPENEDQKTVTFFGYYTKKAAKPAGKNIVGGFCTTCEWSETMCGCPSAVK